ncbi:MAG: cyclohexa-1,5-dienecarbonyl-CoA hydratase [Rhodospirillaceae bacterium]|jgi:cyclohexa-1,5-dienecarbonyl-CoA hydratase|nr:cyclohexa-1,5-dienecarbonyl-CoA hydratase [Rhodospirillaceae bacterium]MBT5243851.1 cyclohexa-1,5-dienecarbonyl-CoA hydratase [Rhodospirillaceae bacterium]MBT5562900.1 cyclohexa-1,5-dienecarbonyl-CoA hydratase [Rhodospirillaceae bacterium]MBT6241299.1 cyclohexa-1,5-dienecarbonyl-CoA hydratase [Rhodospirillaceae bacterium]MBT7138738.1 cyclohexa-1,5-dienecarbonyl-CoA hydratase [Rhodospirillaceae bacterium]
MTEGALKVWREKDDRLLRLRLNRAKANIIDAEMIVALDTAISDVIENPDVHAVLLDHEGPHFSFGASVEEHMPDQCAEMLRALHSLIKKMLVCPAPIMVAVGGQCLGGGLEVAMAGNMMFVAPGASLGQPEVKLAVFAPAASCLLPRLAGQQAAEDMLLSGRSISGDEAVRLGIALKADEDPETAALAYFDEHLAGLSASTLRFALTAARQNFAESVSADLDRVEALYLEGLMKSDDAHEGLKAFVEKRSPQWSHS